MRKLAMMLAVVVLMAGIVSAAGDSPIAGRWQGKMGDVPAVTLTIKDDDGKLSGTVIFYRIVFSGRSPEVAGKSRAEMIDAKLDGKMFTFQTKGSQGEMLSYQLELTGKNEGSFKGKTTMASANEAPPIKMVRE